MNNDLKNTLREVLEAARYAPSVHNVQPWTVEFANDSLYITVDAQHKLVDGDPTGRETTISIGIFTEAVRLAALDKGLTADHVAFDNNDCVTIHFKNVRDHGRRTDENSQLLKKRCTDRSIYRKVELTASEMEAIKGVEGLTGTRVLLSTDRAIINKVATLTRKALGVALSSPNFRKELSGLLVLPWSSKRRGIAVSSLYIPWAVAVMEPIFMRLGLGLRTECRLERRRWLSASGIVFITAKGDMPRFWFEVGRTYMRVSLVVEKAGLSQATSAAIVEASNYHEDIEALLHTDQRILAMIRVGKGHKTRHYSPRVSVDELLH